MKYVEISKDILKKIEDNIYEEGKQIPTETALAKEYGVSKITIKKSLNTLQEKGIIFRQRGMGTFVRRSIRNFEKFTHDQTKGFTRANENKFKIKTKVNSLEIELATDKINKLMSIPKEEYVYSFERVRFKNDTPVSVERGFVPIKFVSGLTKTILEGSLFEFVEKTTKSKISSVHKDISIIEADEHIAEELSIKKGEKVVYFEEIHYLTSGDIFEYSNIYMTCENFNLFVVYNA